MASVTLGSKAEGSIIKLRENGIWVDFYVAKHDYESGLNGAGRTLLVRKEPYENRQWHSSLVNAYAKSDIDAWLDGTYKNLLNANIRALLRSTMIYYTPGDGNTNKTTLSRGVFLLSATELGLQTSYAMNAEGTALSSAVCGQLKIARLNGTAAYQWTRSPSTLENNKAWLVSPTGGAGTQYTSYSDGARPAFTLPSTLKVTDSGYINFAPSTPGSITIPETVNGGTTIEISWTASTDAEGNLEGYKVERSTNGGSSWTQIYQGSALSTTNSVAFGTVSVMYRVKACDSEGLESGWRTSAQRTVLNNRAPTAPGSITVPEAVYGGGPLTVSWTASTDSDGNLSGYALERQADGGDWTEIYKGPALTCTDSVTRGWQSVAYRVRAYDSDSAYSGYTASETRAVDSNYAPVIASETASGTDLGEKAEGFALSYQVTDADGDAVTVREYLDAALQRSYEAVLGGENTFQAVDPQYWQTVLNGVHTLKIIASDGKTDSPPYTVAFAKAVHAASVTLAAPMEADAEITVCALSVTGSIPADAAFKVEVTNNALDGEPVWEDCTAAVRNGVNHIFENRTAAGGFAFNFRLAVERGPGGQGGYITSIQGGFQ